MTARINNFSSVSLGTFATYARRSVNFVFHKRPAEPFFQDSWYGIDISLDDNSRFVFFTVG